VDRDINHIEEGVSKYFNQGGWENFDGISKDAILYDDLRNVSKLYVKKTRLRVMDHIESNGDFILDMASGPIQFKEYLEYSKNFKKRYCVDLSLSALEQAKKKIHDHGIYINKSFFDIDFDDNFFDCSISLHTIYHIYKDRQEEAVRKLISITKPGRKVIIVYANPFALDSMLSRLFKRVFKGKKNSNALYFYAYNLRWWKRFENEGTIKMYPWRSFSATAQKAIFPNNKLGSIMFDLLFKMEDKFPTFFVRFFQYPIIVIEKNI
jgi:ubiquinone/menaquinone biosynthesis C-methylase UbiE